MPPGLDCAAYQYYTRIPRFAIGFVTVVYQTGPADLEMAPQTLAFS